jgi:N-acetylmuramoyl-L-alanine amidase
VLPPEVRIYACAEWGAQPPRRPIVLTGRPRRIIEHHTAGHAPSLDREPGETLAEVKAYARALQRDHFARGWIDTGYNFLVSRAGHVLEGRHGSKAAIATGRMVISAHCRGENDQPGIEYEHLGMESLTAAQKRASIELHAWICRQTGIRPVEFHPHARFNSTECPSAIVRDWLPELRDAVTRRLRGRAAARDDERSKRF